MLITVTGRDTLGRMTARTIAPGSTATGLSPLAFLDTWKYDSLNAKGQLDTVTRQRGISPSYTTVWQESTTYDVASQPTALSTTITEGSPATLGYGQSYDGYGRPLTVTYPSALQVQTGYATYGQTSSLSNAVTQSTYWIATAADAWGHVTEDNANGIDGAYSYDAQTGQSTSRNWKRSGTLVTSPSYSCRVRL